MTEEKKYFNDHPLVEFKDATEYFAQRGTRSCPACGHNGWRVFTSMKSKNGPMLSPGLSAVRLEDAVALSQGMPMVTATCKKCSFVRMHGYADIAVWVQEGKPEFKEDE